MMLSTRASEAMSVTIIFGTQAMIKAINETTISVNSYYYIYIQRKLAFILISCMG